MVTKGRRRKKKVRTGKLLVTCMVLAFVGIISFRMAKLYQTDSAYAAEQEQLEAELADEQARAEELEAQQDYVGTDEYVEDVARSKLGMVYPDEILFKEE